MTDEQKETWKKLEFSLMNSGCQYHCMWPYPGNPLIITIGHPVLGASSLIRMILPDGTLV